MSFFNRLSPRKRKFQAALTMILAEYTYRGLSEEERQKVDEAVKEVVTAAQPEAPTLAYYAMPEEYRYGLIAAALKQLGIPPAVPGEKWSLVGNPFSVNFDDPKFDKAVEDAIAYLQEKGVELYPEDDEPDDYHLGSSIASIIDGFVASKSLEEFLSGDWYVVLRQDYGISLTRGGKDSDSRAIVRLNDLDEMSNFKRIRKRTDSIMGNSPLGYMATDNLALAVLRSMKDQLD